MTTARKFLTVAVLTLFVGAAAACSATATYSGKSSGSDTTVRHHDQYHFYGDYTP